MIYIKDQMIFNSSKLLYIYLKEHFNSSTLIKNDSRNINPGDIYFLISETFSYIDENDKQKNINLYFEMAVSKKAGIIVFDTKDCSIELQHFLIKKGCFGCKKLLVDSGKIASSWYNNNKVPCQYIGITGTNGKTSISFWITELLNRDYTSGYIGTLGCGQLNNLQQVGFTTPNACMLQLEIKKLLMNNVKNIVMEVSSHALQEHRIDGIKFKTAIFTNLTIDHLDYHKTMENYKNCKKRLFTKYAPSNSILNMDDKIGQEIAVEIYNKSNIWFYSINKSIFLNKTFDFYFNKVFLHSCVLIEKGYICKIQINTKIYSNVFIPVFGKYNISNMLAVICALMAENYKIEYILHNITSISQVEGRMNLININKKKFPDVFIDFAHTPDALLNVLKELKAICNLKKGKLWCIFGCGGERDEVKRKYMGEISQRYSDFIVITSDNSRSESFMDITNMILKGINKSKNYIIIEDRRESIKYSIQNANVNDIILIAGKGHENNLIIKDKIIPHSDKKCTIEIMNDINFK